MLKNSISNAIRKIIDALRRFFKTISRLIKSIKTPQLTIHPDDTREKIRKKVKTYVKKVSARQEADYQTWLRNLDTRHGKTASKNRALVLILAALVSVLILAALVTPYVWLVLQAKIGPENWAKWLEPNVVYSALISLLVASPVAFAVWRFRDQNTLWQIENERKDINLKDFQRLCELASGNHFPESKKEDNSYVTRLQNAKTLQIAAVYQLQSFMDGNFGEQFARPAFLLLKSVWESLAAPFTLTAPLEGQSASNEETFLTTQKQATTYRETVKKTMGTGLGLVLQQTLTDEGGKRLRRFSADLIGSHFLRLNNDLPGLRHLQLSKVNMNGINLQGAELSYAELQGANLSYAELQGAVLLNAQLQGADLRNANLQGANLSKANLQGANLSNANLQGANLRGANLLGALLFSVRLQGADLSGAQLQGAYLWEAQLQGADLRGAQLQGAVL